ncbi:hypothetical protein WG66_006231 [Moniliophthora roreri]|nr:hypothetical protein WG66_006231 [Moniliophthora roreri]
MSTTTPTTAATTAAAAALSAPPAGTRLYRNVKISLIVIFLDSPVRATNGKKERTRGSPSLTGSRAASSEDKEWGAKIKWNTGRCRPKQEKKDGYRLLYPMENSRIYTLPTNTLVEIMINLEKARNAAGVGTYYRMIDTKEATKVLLFHNIIPQIVSLFEPAVVSVPESTILGGTANTDALDPRGFADIRIFTLAGVTVILVELKRCIIATDGLVQLLRQMITVRESNRRRGIDGKVVGILSDGNYFLFTSLGSHKDAIFKCEVEYQLNADDYDRFSVGIQLVICHIFTIILDSLVGAVRAVAAISKRRSKDDALEINSIAYLENHAQEMIGEQSGESMLPTHDSFEGYESLGNALASVGEILSLCPSENEVESVKAMAELKQLVISLGIMIPGANIKALSQPEARYLRVKLGVKRFRTQREIDWRLFAALQRCKDGSMDGILLRVDNDQILEVPSEALHTWLKVDPDVEQHLQQAFIHTREQLRKIQPVKLGSLITISLGIFLDL